MDLNIGRGRILPTLSWEGVWQGVLQWFGVAEESMSTVLPNLPNFPTEERITQAQLFTGG
jgi:cullin-associated NEDD8-dissociated protein 1